ncbi:hypothetical protein BDV59DRAFT_193387 [Aspergillus ambiguus]|uniref:uncharacterized protein n=1 Tax=Aspergillus ambiguus TaxID=176160 RepID=UPI003CCE07BF
MAVPWKQQPQKEYFLHNAIIVNPIDGSLRHNSCLHLADGFIRGISSVAPAESNAAIHVDLNGKYVCPGLMDCHVHITAVPGGKGLSETFTMHPDRSKLRQPFVCRQILQRGFTTIRDCGGATLALKEALADGVIQGPRLFIAGHALSQTGGHGDIRDSFDSTRPHGDDCCAGMITGLGRIVDGVDECLKASRDELRLGADFLKIMAGGGVASPTDALEHLQFSGSEIAAITSAATHRETYVTAHAYTPQSIRHAIYNGVRGIEHGNLIDRETARLMAERGVFLTPTLVTYAQMASDEWRGFLPPELQEKNEKVLAAGLRSLQIAKEEGVTICYGTDLLGAMTSAQTKEFSIRSQALSALDILQSATINPARMMGQENRLGQIKEGFLADLLILDQNPLDNIKIFDEPDKHLLAVLKEGRVQVSRWSKMPQEVFGLLPVIE